MTDQKQDRRLSKIIGYMLGKAPEEFGLMPDEEGFVKIRELLKALHEEEGWRHVRPATLNELSMALPEVSFEIRDSRIRSSQRAELTPPVIAHALPRCLYTSVRVRAYSHVTLKGVTPSDHRRVLLFADREQAEKIGRRKSLDSITLTVHTEKAEQQGVIFYRAGEKLYLADYIPAECFSGPLLPREKKQVKKRPHETSAPPVEEIHNQAGAFFLKPLSEKDKVHGRSDNNRRGPRWKQERRKSGRKGRGPVS